MSVCCVQRPPARPGKPYFANEISCCGQWFRSNADWDKVWKFDRLKFTLPKCRTSTNIFLALFCTLNLEEPHWETQQQRGNTFHGGIYLWVCIISRAPVPLLFDQKECTTGHVDRIGVENCVLWMLGPSLICAKRHAADDAALSPGMFVSIGAFCRLR